MDKTVATDVAKIRTLYREGDKKTRSVIESIFGTDVLKVNDDEMLSEVEEMLSENEIHSESEIKDAIDWVRGLLTRKAVPATGDKTAPWAVKNAKGKVIGVAVPIINKVFYFDDVPENDEEMNWDDAMAHAKKLGRTLPSKRELHLCYFFKDEINAIAEAAGHPDFLSGWIWSSTEYGTGYAWYVGFNSGLVFTGSKYGTTGVVRPVADI